MNSFNSFNDVLNSKPRRKLYEAARVVFAAQKIVGDGRTVKTYKNRTLTVMVGSSTAAVILRSESDELIKKINQTLAGGKIERIKIRVGD